MNLDREKSTRHNGCTTPATHAAPLHAETISRHPASRRHAAEEARQSAGAGRACEPSAASASMRSIWPAGGSIPIWVQLRVRPRRAKNRAGDRARPRPSSRKVGGGGTGGTSANSSCGSRARPGGTVRAGGVPAPPAHRSCPSAALAPTSICSAWHRTAPTPN
eukprot:scaffold30782_cov90-Isochrysis_galbana.AAC.1